MGPKQHQKNPNTFNQSGKKLQQFLFLYLETHVRQNASGGSKDFDNPYKMTVLDTFDVVNDRLKAIESLLFEVSSISLLQAVILS